MRRPPSAAPELRSASRDGNDRGPRTIRVGSDASGRHSRPLPRRWRPSRPRRSSRPRSTVPLRRAMPRSREQDRCSSS